MNKVKIANKGITLIALVITVIVLLILAGVTISALSGDNGILQNAGRAKEETEIGNEKDQIGIAVAGTVADNEGGDLTEDKFRTNLVDRQGNDATVTDEGENLRVKFNDTEREYLVNKITGELVEPLKPATPGVPADGMQEYDGAKIPDGFTVSEDPTEQDVDSGLVVIAPDGSEFVWVPVEDFSEFKREHFGTELQKWWNNFVTDQMSNNNLYEPEGNGETETTEVEQMYKSVKDNKGFYIGRYEAGNDGNNNAVSKKGVNVYNNIKWGNSMTDETEGAVEKARNFDTQCGNSNIISTLVYGVQWDAVMRWISKDDALKGYLTDSSDIGNYSGILNSITGENDSYQMKNIYDLAGNVAEWTMETYSDNIKVIRGGYYDDDGSIGPCSNRINGHNPEQGSADTGFRLALFVRV